MESTKPRPNGNAEHEQKTAYKRKLFESRREREFYSYYESVLAHANSEPKFCDLDSPEAVERHVAVSSTNKTLTALAQLASLRLGTRRAMIFFFDSEYAYIIAESTRTLSLHDDADHAPGDDLWLGFTKIPRGYSVCEVTAELPANEGSNAQDPGTQSIAHIVNNLAEDTRFCDRPYVLDGPRARFYAGVPITTPKGFNIGALCVLDDKPRHGLEDGQVEFLRDLASTVMSHLSLVRAKEDNQRSHNMNTALGAFVEGKSKSRDWWHRSAHASSSPDLASDAQGAHLRTFNGRVPTSSQQPDSGDVLAAKVPSNTSDASFGSTKADEKYLAAALSHCGPDPENPPVMEHSSPTRPTCASRSKSNESSGPATSPREEYGENKRDLSTRVKAAVTRAAGLIQEALCADGVLFLDAAVGSFGGLIDGAQGLSQTETETDVSLASDHGVSGGARERRGKDEPVASKVTFAETTKQSIALGSAYSSDIEARVRDAMQQAKFSDKVLRSLLRRYPDGQVWHFNADGDASDDDENDTDGGMSSTSAAESAGSELENPATPSRKRANRRMRSRQKDARAIQSIFPGIRSLVFLGMWDPHQERWFGASVVLSYSSTRMFSVRNELSYLAAFCDVILGDIWRLEAQELGRSKSDFISTISHELRSPLHGILGSAECLEEQAQTSLSHELIRSINSCGTTLLDVINDLLEYSRLNHSTRKRRKIDSTKAPNHADASNGESGVMIDALTEDAVDAACLGFEQQSPKRKGSSMTNDEHGTVLTLNIEEAQSLHWLSDVGSGAWKRICLNLVTNALKYTHRGYISVSLRKRWLQHSAGKEKSARVELVVEDSGIGMSDEFQVKRLFRPFQQESSLTPGTGLGLNLVAQMVKNLGGNVHIQSRIGEGTTVMVSLPLRRVQTPPSSTPTTMDRDLAGASHVKFIGFDCNEADSTDQDLRSKAEKRLLNSLKRYCKQMGLSTSGDDVTLNDAASLHIIREHALVGSPPQRQVFAAGQPETPVIVICATRESALRQRIASTSVGLPPRTEYLWLPIGPVKLANAVQACLNANVKSEELQKAGTDPSLNSSSDALGPSDVLAKASPAIGGADIPNVQDQSGAGHAVDPADAELTRDASRVSTLPRFDRTASDPVLGPDLLSLQMRPQIRRTNTPPDNTASALSLLLVDDNAVNLRLLQVFAKRSGHNYRVARNGQEAVEVYENATKATQCSDDPQASKCNQDTPIAKPEVVLMDINMPVMDGFEAARTIRRFEQASGCPRSMIIAVTGLGDTAAQEQSFTSGMDLFLTKPVKLKELAAILTVAQQNGAQ